MRIAFILLLVRPTNDIERLAYWCLFIYVIFDQLYSCVSIYLLGYQRYDLYTYSYFIPYIFQYIGSIITFLLFGVAGPLICFAVCGGLRYILGLIVLRKCSEFPLSDLFSLG